MAKRQSTASGEDYHITYQNPVHKSGKGRHPGQRPILLRKFKYISKIALSALHLLRYVEGVICETFEKEVLRYYPGVLPAIFHSESLYNHPWVYAYFSARRECIFACRRISP